MLCRVNLGPRRIFIMYYLMRYGLNFKTDCVFRSKNRLQTYCSAGEKLKPRHLFLVSPLFKRGYYQLSVKYIICATCANYTSQVVFFANVLHAKCKLCYKSRVYPHQLGTSPL